MAYDNPPGLIAAAAIVQTIVYVVVALRFQTRHKHGRKYHPSDWLILLAAFLSTGLSIIQIYGSAVGRLGVPVHGSIGSPTFRQSTALNLRWYQWAVFLNGVVVTGLIKISVSFFYLQIFSVKYRYIIVPWLVLMVLWTIGFTILMLTFCGNHGLWPSIPLSVEKSQCLSGTKIGYAIVIGGTVTDFLTVLIPLPMVFGLQLPLKQKLAVMGVFTIGLLSVGGSVAKAYIYISSALKKSSMDYATIITSISVWGLVESQFGIIAATLMTLGPLLRDLSNSRMLGSIMNSTRNLLVSLSSPTQATISKAELSKTSSEQPEGYRDGSSVGLRGV
ncbi:hypothetical protein BU24DRAFT_497874 [Aaosphaeria arxii CBS 175.79]|uniref:Rhodopsin domain-containing protein n=1 Tax=Aaosphaeria arxii CBS 175.79 TaxID=1450172 RepID=A0A6A5X6Y9_9PLEO|nr:uncharacterized protein BU24DRAFT_497874 [Aaosphaeria arxii CBS 175.79]KAF2008699.1 hypothetical protein BU24DRAFT_497874 [Aaosphaeria arxii CBS 175.79]